MDTHEGLLPVNCLLLASLLRDLDAAAKERQLSRTGLVRLLAANEVARQRAQREIIAALCTAAGVPPARVRTIPPLAMWALGLFVPTIREIKEIRYQFDTPFIVDSSAAQTTFGLAPTPMPQALNDTVSWYRELRITRERTHDHPRHAT